ncbi:MAG: hypothetical protein ACQEQI_05725 [Bacillota bacterium]
MTLVESKVDGDKVIEVDDLKLALKPKLLDNLEEGKIDYADSIFKRGFVIT